jgi:glycosyltransferase involved in cell wall biosynthesis
MSASGPVGTIGLLTTEHGRYSRFWTSFMGILAPGPVRIITKYSLNIAEARNQIFEEAEGEWVWFMDDDHTFDQNLLINLIKRNVDVVQPLVLSRYAPFSPVIMGPRTADGVRHWKFALQSDDPPMKPVYVAGTAGMLIRRYVWEKIPKPWFTMGEVTPEVLGEDVSFCRRVKDAGFQVWCDMENTMGHLNVGEVRPRRNPDGTWVTVVKFGNGEFEVNAPAGQFRVDPSTGKVYDQEGNEMPEGVQIDESKAE